MVRALWCYRYKIERTEESRGDRWRFVRCRACNKTMAKHCASLLWALLFMACLMSSGRSFVVHQHAQMMRSSVRSSSWRHVGSVAQRGESSRSLVQRQRAGCSRRHRSVGMKATAGATAGGGGEFENYFQPTNVLIIAHIIIGGPSDCTATGGNR